jgi:hypothetical protein
MALLNKGISDSSGIVLVLLPKIMEYRVIFERSAGFQFAGFIAFKNIPGS